jgi:hypothetical protein
MKLSVIFGIFHMCLGILIKGTNAIYFRQIVVLFCEVIGGFIILFGLFGWMDLLIFFKWFYPLDIEDKTIINQEELEDGLNQDNIVEPKFKGDYDNEHMPSIVQIMINTIFGFGQVSDAEKERSNNWYIGNSVD